MATHKHLLLGKTRNSALRAMPTGKASLTSRLSATMRARRAEDRPPTADFHGVQHGRKNDLVAAMGNESNYTWDGTASGEAPKVSMTFRHMLSKLTFTFKTKITNTYTVAVNNLRIESATTKSTGTYHKPTKAQSRGVLTSSQTLRAHTLSTTSPT